MLYTVAENLQTFAAVGMPIPEPLIPGPHDGLAVFAIGKGGYVPARIDQAVQAVIGDPTTMSRQLTVSTWL